MEKVHVSRKVEKNMFISHVDVTHVPIANNVTLAVILLSVLLAGGVRNSHDNKVSGQLSSNSTNHNTRLGSDEEYMNMAHRLGNEVMQRIKIF